MRAARRERDFCCAGSRFKPIRKGFVLPRPDCAIDADIVAAGAGTLNLEFAG
ncbi:MAG: hypothetical protein JNJ54_23895 [Myxococcaceae bacterium]|nr:hypothetical protein [Myxococcaceae bacterium]